MAPFAGWEMPVQYTSILEEATSVRTNAGLFDVSHMGRLELAGCAAAALLDTVLSVNVPKMRQGRARYNVVCTEEGGIIDDCIVYRRGDQEFLLIPNAANTGAVLDCLAARSPRPDQVRIDDVTSRYAMIAHQGPRAAEMLQPLTEADLSSIKLFAAVGTRVAGADAYVARTGYTGEDGFELIVPAASATTIWKELMDRGATPCGLGARDVLRLEAGLLLHGNDMDTSVNPYEAGLERFVDPDRDSYLAGPALRRIRERGVTRKLAGFNMVERGIARHGYAITDGQKVVGRVTSGGPSPTLDRNIGLGYVPTGLAAPGSRIYIEVRGRPVAAEVASIPFYARSKSA
jgi:aminomethyltransferase